MATILIADDNVDYAELISELMRREGHDSVIAKNGREAIDILREDNVFQLIITDLLMPEIDGFGVIRFVRDMEKKIPIIVLSGGGVTIGSADALKMVENIVDEVLPKPVDLDLLMGKINGLLTL